MFRTFQLVLSVFVLLLSACGFHLRGQFDLPEGLQKIALENQSQDPLLIKSIQSQLLANGIRVDHSAPLAIKILSSQFSRSDANLSSNTQWRQYTLQYRAQIQFKNAKQHNDVLNVNSVRYTSENPNVLLGSKNEIRTLKQEMRQELAIRILDQLNTPSIRKLLSNQGRQ